MEKQAEIGARGFALQRAAVRSDVLEAIGCLIATSSPAAWKRTKGSAYAVRDLQMRCPQLGPLLLRGGVVALASAMLGTRAQFVSATLFDKTSDANWAVPAHQDVFVPVAERKLASGYRAWSLRDGVHHVSPPDSVLARLLAMRIHLDDSSRESGILQVHPATHHRRLTHEQIARLSPDGYEDCPARAGDVLWMRPLAVHRSRSSLVGGRRRVLHLVYSTVPPGGGLAWTAASDAAD